MTTGDKEDERKVHFILDAHCANMSLITSRSRMRNWLQALAEKADMRIADEPYIKGYSWPGGSDHNALTCFQPLMESGITVHCYPEKGFIFLDVFSCKDLNLGKVFGFVRRSLKTDHEKVVVLARGIVGNCEIRPASIILNEELNPGDVLDAHYKSLL